jgi:hypothetical protein
LLDQIGARVEATEIGAQYKENKPCRRLILPRAIVHQFGTAAKNFARFLVGRSTKLLAAVRLAFDTDAAKFLVLVAKLDGIHKG